MCIENDMCIVIEMGGGDSRSPLPAFVNPWISETLVLWELQFFLEGVDGSGRQSG